MEGLDLCRKCGCLMWDDGKHVGGDKSCPSPRQQEEWRQAYEERMKAATEDGFQEDAAARRDSMIQARTRMVD